MGGSFRNSFWNLREEKSIWFWQNYLSYQYYSRFLYLGGNWLMTNSRRVEHRLESDFLCHANTVAFNDELLRIEYKLPIVGQIWARFRSPELRHCHLFIALVLGMDWVLWKICMLWWKSKMTINGLSWSFPFQKASMQPSIWMEAPVSCGRLQDDKSLGATHDFLSQTRM
jgi:hypothetical protein